MKKTLLLLSLTLVLICLTSDAFYAQSDLQDVQKKLAEVSQILNKATIDGDYETLLNWYTDDAVIKPDFSPAIRGKRALREQYEQNKKKGVKINSFTTTTEDMWIRGNEVYERGTFGLASSLKNVPQPTAIYGSYFQIWQQQPDGSFKIKYTIWNLDFDPYNAR